VSHNETSISIRDLIQAVKSYYKNNSEEARKNGVKNGRINVTIDEIQTVKFIEGIIYFYTWRPCKRRWGYDPKTKEAKPLGNCLG
jgi:hypothetical protein